MWISASFQVCILLLSRVLRWRQPTKDAPTSGKMRHPVRNMWYQLQLIVVICWSYWHFIDSGWTTTFPSDQNFRSSLTVDSTPLLPTKDTSPKYLSLNVQIFHLNHGSFVHRVSLHRVPSHNQSVLVYWFPDDWRTIWGSVLTLLLFTKATLSHFSRCWCILSRKPFFKVQLRTWKDADCVLRHSHCVTRSRGQTSPPPWCTGWETVMLSDCPLGSWRSLESPSDEGPLWWCEWVLQQQVGFRFKGTRQRQCCWSCFVAGTSEGLHDFSAFAPHLTGEVL